VKVHERIAVLVEFDGKRSFELSLGTTAEPAKNRIYLFDFIDFPCGDGLRVKPRQINGFQRVRFRIRQQIRGRFVALYSRSARFRDRRR
jgi:hypothetical protein